MTLGPYKIIALIGAGGMGEVFRALDTRLGREVALKVLAPHLAATPEVRTRFEREARTISQLNDPHICTLYDVGRQEGLDYLVMELVEGETLARRLERGPLPNKEVLALGAQIAEALDRAHRGGVVHRDLKPGNVMLTAGGAKLMDFGLARAAGLAPAAGALSESPTLSRPLTAEGTIVGTFQYMAPEQLEGKEADARTDIWALGCVLYEMATGRRAFEGDSQASLIAAIMDHEPPAITSLKPLSPPALDHLVRRCLAKNPADRWQSARDVALEFNWIAEVGSQAGVPAPVLSRRRTRERLAWGLALAAITMAIAVSATLFLTRGARRVPEQALARFAVTAPGGATVVTDPSTAAISPDGRKLAFIAIDQAGVSRLWIRPLDSLSAGTLPGTEGAFCPFWSADSRFLGFFAGGKLWKVPVAGGPRGSRLYGTGISSLRPRQSHRGPAVRPVRFAARGGCPAGGRRAASFVFRRLAPRFRVGQRRSRPHGHECSRHEAGVARPRRTSAGHDYASARQLWISQPFPGRPAGRIDEARFPHRLRLMVGRSRTPGPSAHTPHVQRCRGGRGGSGHRSRMVTRRQPDRLSV